MEFKGECIVPGELTAKALITKKPLLFNWIDPETGIVNQKNNELYGLSVTSKVLIVPCFKANIDMWGLYVLCKRGQGPAALISHNFADDFMIVGAILVKLPLIHLTKPDPSLYLSDDQVIKISGSSIFATQ